MSVCQIPEFWSAYAVWVDCLIFSEDLILGYQLQVIVSNKMRRRLFRRRVTKNDSLDKFGKSSLLTVIAEKLSD